MNPSAPPLEFGQFIDAFARHLAQSSLYFQEAGQTSLSIGEISTSLVSKHAAYRKSQAEAEAALMALDRAMEAWPAAKKPIGLLHRGVREWLRLIENSVEVNSITAASEAERRMPHLESLWSKNRDLSKRADALLADGARLLEQQFRISIDLSKIFPA